MAMIWLAEIADKLFFVAVGVAVCFGIYGFATILASIGDEELGHWRRWGAMGLAVGAVAAFVAVIVPSGDAIRAMAGGG